ncbi:MAG: hypothetical protein FWD23_18740 [Oscillospiraceae bacterium]|nr:hypothetical protein [Oscillospiraceae bacterium]
MKTLNVTWDGIHDSTGYLFSFAKSLSCAVKNSPWAEYAEDIIATSGFAFRMWVAADLCPSSTSIWSFDIQKSCVENGGLTCEYVGRYWEQDTIEKQKWLEAIANIKKSIDNGVPAVSWDIGIPEWGLITGYDDEKQVFSTLAVNMSQTELPYDVLGKRELPILSVLTLTGASGKPQDEILKDTVKLAVAHLKGGEWCDNAKGLEAYPVLMKHFEPEVFTNENGFAWNREYLLGTYGELKYYAYKYFEKTGQSQLAELYQSIHSAWMEAFRINKTGDGCAVDILAQLKLAQKNEISVVEIMEKMI